MRAKISVEDQAMRLGTEATGYSCYPTSKKTFVKDLIYRGIQLTMSVAREVKQAGEVIEVYPFAGKVRLFGKTMPRKTTRQGMCFIRDRLEEILPGLEPYCHMFGHDLCDAAVAAYTAFLPHESQADALGSNQEGLILITVKR